MRLVAAAAAAVVTAAGALAFGCALPDAQPAVPGAVRILAEPVEIVPDKLGRLHLRGTMRLTADNPAFGGISGMLIEDGRIIAVADHGWLIEAGLVDDANGLRPEGGMISHLFEEAGDRADASAQDAEALARTGDGRLAVAFERDHRIQIFGRIGPGGEIRDRVFERLKYNEGLEALATLPDGRLLAIAEARATGGFPAFLVDADGTVRAARLALPDALPVTGADIGPDGRLYLLRRDFSPLQGLTIRIERYRLAPDGLPMPETRDSLAAFDGWGIDNMEAIAIWRDRDGRIRLAIASDDNYRPVLQRTLLMDFEVLE